MTAGERIRMLKRAEIAQRMIAFCGGEDGGAGYDIPTIHRVMTPFSRVHLVSRGISYLATPPYGGNYTPRSKIYLLAFPRCQPEQR